jgi:valyl-tRNA synthetase
MILGAKHIYWGEAFQPLVNLLQENFPRDHVIWGAFTNINTGHKTLHVSPSGTIGSRKLDVHHSNFNSPNKTLDQEVLKPFEVLKEVVTQVRNIRQQKNISPKEKLEVKERSDVGEKYSSFDSVIVKLANLSSYSYTKEKVEGAFGFMVLNAEFFVPLTGNINVAEEKERLTKELEYNKGFLKSVQVKLSNERFVANAKPEIIDGERKKESDALNKIKSIEAQLASL